MKHKTNFRLLITFVTITTALLFLGSKRVQDRRMFNKAARNVNGEEKNLNVSNTDYIFFESLSKYLFISLEK